MFSLSLDQAEQFVLEVVVNIVVVVVFVVFVVVVVNVVVVALLQGRLFGGTYPAK